MTLFPFLKRQYFTKLKPGLIRERLGMSIVETGWKIIYNNDHFILTMAKSGTGYGKTRLLTFLTGTIITTKDSGTMLVFIIRPLKRQTVFFLSLHLFAAFGIFQCIKNNNNAGIIVCTLLITATYISILMQFNREKIAYINFIEGKILGS